MTLKDINKTNERNKVITKIISVVCILLAAKTAGYTVSAINEHHKEKLPKEYYGAVCGEAMIINDGTTLVLEGNKDIKGKKVAKQIEELYEEKNTDYVFAFREIDSFSGDFYTIKYVSKTGNETWVYGIECADKRDYKDKTITYVDGTKASSYSAKEAFMKVDPISTDELKDYKFVALEDVKKGDVETNSYTYGRSYYITRK